MAKYKLVPTECNDMAYELLMQGYQRLFKKLNRAESTDQELMFHTMLCGYEVAMYQLGYCVNHVEEREINAVKE